jgi:hypothetical protein
MQHRGRRQAIKAVEGIDRQRRPLLFFLILFMIIFSACQDQKQKKIKNKIMKMKDSAALPWCSIDEAGLWA